jgi:hypothetical protein
MFIRNKEKRRIYFFVLRFQLAFPAMSRASRSFECQNKNLRPFHPTAEAVPHVSLRMGFPGLGT